jgi:hypothetical protein
MDVLVNQAFLTFIAISWLGKRNVVVIARRGGRRGFVGWR